MMQINNNLNSLIQLEKKLETSTNNLRKLTQENKHSKEKDDTSLNKQLSTSKQNIDDSSNSLEEELVEQEISIPLAYTANAQVISMKDATTKTIIDIKA